MFIFEKMINNQRILENNGITNTKNYKVSFNNLFKNSTKPNEKKKQQKEKGKYTCKHNRN